MKSGVSEEEFRKRDWRGGRRKGGKIPTMEARKGMIKQEDWQRRADE